MDACSGELTCLFAGRVDISRSRTTERVRWPASVGRECERGEPSFRIRARASRPGRRASSVRVAAALLAVVLEATSGAAQSIAVRVGNPPNAVVPSDPVSIPVVVDMSAAGTLDIASLTFTLNWDPVRLTYTSATAGTFGTVTFDESGTATGLLTVGMSNATGTTTTFTVATVDYDAGATSGNVPITINVTAAGNGGGSDILASVSGASLTLCVGTTGPLGDVNNDAGVNIIDAQQVARVAVSLPAPPDPARAASHGDVTEDAVVNIIDAQQIARLSVGLSTAAAPNIGTPLAGGCPPPNQAPTSTIDNPSQDTTVTLGDAANFQGTASDADGTIASHAWDFGDGNGASVEDPGNYTYAAVGIYTVTYQVTDDDGGNSPPANVTVTVVSPPITNYALRFFGNGVNDIDRVKIRIDDPATVEPGPPVDVGATDFTIEFWMRATAAENGSGAVSCGNNLNWIFGNIIIDRDRFFQDRKYGISVAGGQIVFGVSGDGTGNLTICGTSRVDDGVWHHIAVTRERSSGALQLFVDGVREANVATGPGGDISYPDDGVPNSACNGLPCTNSDPFVVIAAEKHDDDPSLFPSFSGFFDELRYSNVIRYTGNFTRPSGRFAPDANTVGLYHFDEGTGDVIGDTSGAAGGPSDGVRRLGGNPAGPQWVLSDAPTGF